MAATCFLKKKVILCILPVAIDFFHLTLLWNNGHQAKLELFLKKKTSYYMENEKIQYGRHLFSKKISNFVHFACNNWFFHLTMHRKNGPQAKLQLYLIKN